MATPESDELTKSRRPKDTKFKQQKLPAWQPIMTAGTVLPVFFAIGIAFIPIGIALLITSNNVQELSVDYTECKRLGGDGVETCADYLGKTNHTGRMCQCRVNFALEKPFRGDVFLYYGLTNFYQNHRRYVKSRDDNQLYGDNLKGSQLTKDCIPYKAWTNESSDAEIGYAPCGAIANSLFNDSLKVTFHGSRGNQAVGLVNTGIAWNTDKNSKFNNPGNGKNLKEAFKDTLPPPNWQKAVYELDPSQSDNNGYKNEDLIVWMRTAALPNFRKLYRRVNHTGSFEEGLPRGNYTLDIEYAFPVTSFGGTKHMILTTISWLGGKNPFLGIAYLVVGSMCVILGVVFLVIHLRVGKRPSELINEVNSRTTY